MYLFGKLNRKEKRLILILVCTNIFVSTLFFAGMRSYRSDSLSADTGSDTASIERSSLAEPGPPQSR